MRKHVSWFIFLAFIAGIFVMGCAGDDGDDGATGPAGEDGTDFPGPLPEEYVDADGVAGGSVYDQWYSTLAGGQGSLTANYGYTYDGAADGADADFVRCKACHGWDGLGTMGAYVNRGPNATRPTVAAVNLRSTIHSVTPQALFDLIQGEGGRDFNAGGTGHPDYSGLLTDSQIWNLVKAMLEEWLNPNDLYTITVNGVYPSGTRTFSNVGVGGDAANGASLFSTICADCHGADGQTISIDGGTLGAFMRASPHEAWHKMKFGQPGSIMPEGLISATSDIQDLYLAFQNATNYP